MNNNKIDDNDFIINGVFRSQDGLKWSKYIPEKLGK